MDNAKNLEKIKEACSEKSNNYQNVLAEFNNLVGAIAKMYQSNNALEPEVVLGALNYIFVEKADDYNVKDFLSGKTIE